jgi:hypothetical protein
MDELVCFTLEPPFDRTHPAIPYGEYDLTWEYSESLKKDTPRLNGVKDRTGILIHAGNVIEDSRGCILVGSGWVLKDQEPMLTGSRVARDKVYKLMKEDLDGGYAYIEIKQGVWYSVHRKGR